MKACTRGLFYYEKGDVLTLYIKYAIVYTDFLTKKTKPYEIF